MLHISSEEGHIIIPELPVGTKFVIDEWPDKEVTFEVVENHPDETGQCPCCGDCHQCMLYSTCIANKLDALCNSDERTDGKNIMYVGYYKDEEIHF